ncbi:MAG: tetratricopeptide repeat protein [Candidatus Omnitrophica bacterium]|nr:tetratricopeptide repeat protein [Candidatus Omnitrophota bacterium]
MTPYYFLRGAVLFITGLLIYSQTFGFDFVFDDHNFIVNNVYIKNFSHIPLMWHFYPMTRLVGMYSFAFNYYFNQLHPQGYHIFNFIVHLTGVGLVWALAHMLFKIVQWLPSKDRLIQELPFLIALLFLVHPCQTQAVSYISQRFESMATVLYLATVFCYLLARLSKNRTRKILLFSLSGGFTILGVMTKEVVVTVPLMIVAVEWILFPKKINKRPYIVLTAGGILLYLLFTHLVHTDWRVFLQTIPSESHDGDLLTPARYLLTQMRVFLTFLRLMVLPIHQNLDYDYPASTGVFSPPLTFVGLSVIAGIIVLIIKLRRKFPLIAFGLAWIIITFSINLAPRANVIFEHKLYLISFGFFLAGVSVLSIWIKNRRILTGILWGIMAVLVIVSFERNKVWRDDFVLWDDAVRGSPHKARPLNNRGFMYIQQGQLTQAMKDLNLAIAIKPDYADAYNNLGRVYFKQGNSTRDIAEYNKAIAINPNFAEAYNNRGAVYSRRGDFVNAMADYNKAIALNPNSAQAYNNRGSIFDKQGNYNQAMADFNKAIAIDPNLGQAYNNRAVVLYQFKEYYKALENLRMAQKLGQEVNPKFLSVLKKDIGG